MKPIIEHTISLGPFCFNAMFMKKKMYKNASFPFDWLFSNMRMVNDCLGDNFTKFMDKSQHKKKSRRISEHTGYKINTMFNHHDITSKNDYDYFSRCIERFRFLHKRNGTKLFTLIVLSSSLSTDQINTINSIFHKLKSYCGDNFVLLIVCINVTKEGKGYSVDKWLENLYVVNLRTHRQLNGINFSDRTDLTLYDKMIHELFTFKISNPMKGSSYD